MNLQTAMDAISREDFPAALAALNRAIIDASQMQLAECYALRGFVRLRLDQFQHAEDDCTQSIRRRGNDPETLSWRAAARAERNNWRGAFEDLQAARLADTSSPARHTRTMQDYLPIALDHFETRMNVGGDRTEVYFDRASVFLLSGDFKKAGADFQKALKCNDRHGAAHVGLARIALQQEDYAEAIRLAGQAMQLDPDVLPSALACRAEACAGDGQLALALEDVTRLREKVGHQVEGLIECATLRARLGDLAGAIEDLNIAHDMNPDLPIILSLRGAVFAEMRDSAPLPGHDPVRIPGDQRGAIYEDRNSNGVPLHPNLVKTLSDIAGELQVPKLGQPE